MSSIGMNELANYVPPDEQVYHLRRAGHSFSDITTLMGIERAEALLAYRAYMNKLAAEYSLEEREMHVNLEMARLDELQAAIWESAIAEKSVQKIDSILRIMGLRAKLLGFDKITPNPEAVRQIILVTGSQKEFIEALQQGRAEHVVDGDVVEDGVEEEV